MDVDSRLADPPAKSGTGHDVAAPGPPLSTPLTYPSGSGQRPLGATLAPNLAQTQSPPSIVTTPSPASAISRDPSSLVSALLDQKRPRACESCRGLKVRCEPNEQNPLATCKRCAKANRECIFTAPSRKRQKKNDSKVAELEKKIDVLMASLRAQKAAHQGDDEDDDDDYLDDGDTPASDTLKPDASGFSPISRQAKRRRSSDVHATVIEGRDSVQPFPTPNSGKVPTSSHISPMSVDAHRYVYIDVVDRKLLSMEKATSIFNRYVEDMVPHFPAVVFPAGTTAEDVRRKKPTLFLAILAAASGTSHPDLHRALFKEISRAFAERVMINGEKSLELVQALVLCTMWYFVPDNYIELKFYMYIHMAAVMALDIGIGKKRKPRGSLRGLPVPLPILKRPTIGPRGDNEQRMSNERRRGSSGSGGPRKEEVKHTIANAPPPPPPPMPGKPFPDPEAIESRRTLLACYWTCCNTSMAQRKPNLLRYTMFMSECVEVLENSPEAAPTDKVLCQWIKLQKIAEEVGIGFAFDDPNANVSIDDTRIQFSLKGFARQLEEWKSKCPPAALHVSLELAYNTTMTYAHEISLHRDHNVDDFQPPYTESMMREPLIGPNDLLSSCHIDALSRCVLSSHRVLQIFMNMSIDAIRSVPVFTFVRTNYACVILIKLYFSASHPQSDLGKVIDKNSLRVDEHLGRLLEIFRKAAEGGLSRQANTFAMTLTVMRHWFNKQKADIEKGVNAAPEPTNSFKKLELGENSHNGGPYKNGYSNGTGPMEGMETPGSTDDVSSVGTPGMDHLYDPMRPPPPRSLSTATPLHMLSNAALESSHGAGHKYASSTPGIDIAAPRSSPRAPHMGKWEHSIYPIMPRDYLGTPIMAGGGMALGNIGEGSGHDRGGHGGIGAGGGGGDTEAGAEVDYMPQYLFTGNGEMFIDDTFWAMMDGPMNMFDTVGKY